MVRGRFSGTCQRFAEAASTRVRRDDEGVKPGTRDFGPIKNYSVAEQLFRCLEYQHIGLSAYEQAAKTAPAQPITGKKCFKRDQRVQVARGGPADTRLAHR